MSAASASVGMPFQFTRPVGGATRRSRRASATRCFNSRAPWGARLSILAFSMPWICFNSRAPWGARPLFGTALSALAVSIHAPRGGRDIRELREGGMSWKFQFTRPVGGATTQPRCCWTRRGFQFTRPVGGATPPRPAPPPGRRFNSRAPWGARLQEQPPARAMERFQFTRPVGGATADAGEDVRVRVFQFTRPVGGATPASISARCSR